MEERDVNKNKDGRELGGAGVEMDWLQFLGWIERAFPEGSF